MRTKRPSLSAEEQAAFFEAVRGVRPLAVRDRIAVPPPLGSPTRRTTLPPKVSLTVEGDAQRYAARAPGVSLSQVAELRTSAIHLEATLDLHGLTIDAAIRALHAFLLESRGLGRRRVLIVHGKGTHSEHGAPLRDAVVNNLLGDASGLIHAFATAGARDGGEGATVVMLRGSR